jgi:Ca-activated chloride channel family protein
LSVGWPEAFWFAPLLLLFYPLWRWREKQRPTLPYPDTRFLKITPTRRVWLARWVPFIGRLLTGILLLLALANPRWPVPGSQIPSEGIALVFVLDVSGSMAERDVLLDGQPVTRLQAASSVLKRYLSGTGANARGNDAIGLVTFAVRPVDVCPPTLSHASVEYFLNQAQPVGTVPDSSTNIGDAMGVAVDLLRRSGLKSQAIVLISDGEHTVPAEVDKDALKPRQAAQLAAAFGIRVHTIFLSGAPGGDAAKLAEQQRAEATLRSVAEMTQGQASLASDGDGLAQISQKLDALEKSRITSFLYTEYLEGRTWLLLAALVVLLTTIVLEESWLRVVP